MVFRIVIKLASQCALHHFMPHVFTHSLNLHITEQDAIRSQLARRFWHHQCEMTVTLGHSDFVCVQREEVETCLFTSVV